MKTRLHKYIANCGYTSRRHAELLITAGRVEVNGRIVSELGVSVRADKDVVAINGEEIRPPEATTILFNKPAGLITSTHDTHERLTVMDYLPKSLVDRGILPAGRLDQETEGLLIVTNVGDLNHRITHPRYGTEKEYVATVANRPDRRAISRLENGVVIEGGKTAPAQVPKIDKAERGRTKVHLILQEGRKRQVRRMLQAVGHPVVHLERIRIGNLTLGDLPRAEWRLLGSEDLQALTGDKPPENSHRG
ncbi:MAG: pseudouridine synthase [Planctomycetota bacterium]